MRRVRIARSAREMEALRPLWLELEPSATLFQSYAWSLAAARFLGDRERPFVVAVETDAGAAIVPAAVRGDGTATLMGEMLFDYRDLLRAGDEDVATMALAVLADRVGDLSAPAVRQDSHFAALGGGDLTDWVGAPVLRRSDVGEAAFLAQHFKARKQMRRLRRAGAQFARYDGAVAPLVAWVYERKAEQFAGATTDIFSDPARRQCMQAIIAAAPEHADVFTIEVGSAIVAALITFRDGLVRRLYTSWHDPAWLEFSPGIVLLLHACHESLREGLDVDFLTGEQSHKTRFASGRVQLYRFYAMAEQLRAPRVDSRIAA
jgi:CelD/BcsL family acetyltransferase involved in cellulose biosynthesis